MKLVLREDISGLGKRGDLVNVADGYGRNFLIPKGKAILATKGIVNQAEAMRKARDVRDQKAKSTAEGVASKLVSLNLIIKANASQEGKLFGSVGPNEIISALKDQAQIEIDRRTIIMDEHIKDVGTFQVSARLHPEVIIQLNVDVVADEAK